MGRGALAPRNRAIYHKKVIGAVTVAPISHAMYAENASHFQMGDAIRHLRSEPLNERYGDITSTIQTEGIILSVGCDY